MRILLLALAMASVAALDVVPSPVGGEIGLVVPRAWSPIDEAAYRVRFPDNDYPQVAVASPDGAVVFSLHRKPQIAFEGAEATMKVILERIAAKYPHATVDERDRLDDPAIGFAAASFVNPDSAENRSTTIVVFSWDGKLGIATWHRRADAGDEAERVVSEHRRLLLDALRGHR